MTLTPLQTTTASTVNITTIQTVGTYANSGLRLLRPQLWLSGLNGAAATITVKIRNTTDSSTVYRYPESKDVETDTLMEFVFPSFVARDGKSYAIQVLSSNASDTSVTWVVDWYDAGQVDVIQVAGTAQTAGNLVALLNAIDDYIDAEIAAIKAKTDNLPATPADEATLTAMKGTGFDTATDSLVQIRDNLGGSAPSASAIADAVWDEARSGHTTDGTYGDTAEWSGSSAPSAANIASTVWANSTRTLTSAEQVTATEVQSGTISIVQGDSYLNADGNHKTITKVAGAPWPSTLSGWTITFTARVDTNNVDETGTSPASITASGTVVQAADDGDTLQSVRFDLTAAATAVLSTGTACYDYDVQASSGNSRVTLETGTMSVLKQQTTT